MPRGAQVIYPKDLGTILMQADIGPGMRVLEAGVGSGALSMTLLRAGALITGYEIREDFAQQATKNVHDMLGTDVAYDIQIRDVTMGIDERDLDRVILDMPEPWDVVQARRGGASPGWNPSGVPADDQPDPIASRDASPALLRPGRDRGDPASNVAHRRTIGATRSPNGGPHRILHLGAPTGAAASRSD